MGGCLCSSEKQALYRVSWGAGFQGGLGLEGFC